MSNILDKQTFKEGIDSIRSALKAIGSAITIDKELDTTSDNPVANKVVTKEINDLNQNLGDKSSASAVSGNNAFEKINMLNRKIGIGAIKTKVVEMGSITVPANGTAVYDTAWEITPDEGYDIVNTYVPYSFIPSNSNCMVSRWASKKITVRNFASSPQTTNVNVYFLEYKI